MDSDLIRELVPIIAILATFGMPVGIVFVVKHFAFKHRELDAELTARKLLGERDRVELEKRIERLETVVMGARVHGSHPGQAHPALLPATSSSALYEPPNSFPPEAHLQPVKGGEKT